MIVDQVILFDDSAIFVPSILYGHVLLNTLTIYVCILSWLDNVMSFISA